MSNRIIKLAVIRDDQDNQCPFGLSISDGACTISGKTVLSMAPILILGPEATEEEKQAIVKANNHLLMWTNPGERCVYARKLFENEPDKVECSFEEHGENTTALVGSPYYYKQFSNTGIDGLQSLPLGSYFEGATTTPGYMGPYSLEGIATKKDQIKK